MNARVLCPICHQSSSKAYHPFCSKRCADQDLGNWLGETYYFKGRDGEADQDFIEKARKKS